MARGVHLQRSVIPNRRLTPIKGACLRKIQPIINGGIMRISSLGLIGLGTALALTSFVSSASAVVTLNQNLASGWTQGTGTSNGNFAVDTEDNGVELGLRASIRFVGP